MKRPDWISSLIWGMGALVLLYYARDIGAGVANGLRLWLNVLVPSLFPFMVFSHMFGRSNGAKVLGRLAGRITEPLLRLPRTLTSTYLMSLVGGFPVGAKLLSLQYAEKTIDKPTLEQGLCVCVNAGPSFLISAVGMSMLGNASLGVCLLSAQVLSSMILCRWTFRRKQSGNLSRHNTVCKNSSHFGALFVESVCAAGSSMLSMGWTVIAMGAVISLGQGSGIMGGASACLHKALPFWEKEVWEAVLTGLLEVTTGCKAAAALSPVTALGLCGFFVSFSSLSILLQVKGLLPPEISLKKLYLSRLLHGGLTTVLTLLFARWFVKTAVAAGAFPPKMLPQTSPTLMGASLLLMIMCGMLLLWTPVRQKNSNVPCRFSTKSLL